MTKLLLVDFSNTLMRNFFAMKSLSHDGIPTGGVFGFLKTLSIHSSKYKIDKIIVCYDKAPYFRSKFFPEYKSGRGKMEEELRMHINKNAEWTSKALDICGIPRWSISGFEADDLIALLVKKNRKGSTTVLSNDSDMHQLLRPNEKLKFSTSKGLFGYSDFKNKYEDIEPKDIVELTALSGSHNDVPGIHRVGEVTALKMLLDRSKYADKYLEHKKLIKRNKKLIQLPTKLVPLPVIPRFRHGYCNERRLIIHCRKIGIDVNNSMLFGLSRLSDVH